MEEKLSKFLHKYRITPHPTTRISPSKLLMGRRLRSRLDLLHPDLPGKVEGKQWKQKLSHNTSRTDRKFQEGDEVYAEDFSASNEKWIPGVIQKVTGPLSYHIQLSDGHVIRRHVDSVRSRSSQSDQNREEISPTLSDFDVEPEHTESERNETELIVPETDSGTTTEPYASASTPVVLTPTTPTV